MADMLEIEYTRVIQWFKHKHAEEKVNLKSQSASVPLGKLQLGLGDNSNPLLLCTHQG